MWVCEGWEEHVDATCSYLCQLIAADNSVSSEFWCGHSHLVIFGSEKPGTTDWREDGGERSRDGFFRIEDQRAWSSFLWMPLGTSPRETNSSPRNLIWGPGRASSLELKIREGDCVSREGGGERRETWFFRIEDQRVGSSFLRIPLGTPRKGTNSSPRNLIWVPGRSSSRDSGSRYSGITRNSSTTTGSTLSDPRTVYCSCWGKAFRSVPPSLPREGKS